MATMKTTSPDMDTPPPGLDIYADSGPRLVASMITFIVLPTLFVIARLVSRRVAHAGYWYDDFLVTLACLLCYCQITCALVSERKYSLGKHIYALDDPEFATRKFLELLYVYETGYNCSTFAVKLATLAFYRRIFPVQQLKLLLWISLGIVVAYFLGAFFTTIFQCSPIHHFWDRTGPGSCLVNGDNVMIVPGAVNCVIDFLIILLPIPLLWRLRTTTSQKGVLTGIFICAGFVCIISVLRLVVLSRLADVDVTWNYVDAAIWSAAEPGMGVISACIPSLRPLVSLMFRGSTRGLGVSKHGKTSIQETTSSGSRVVVWKSRTDDRDPDGPFTRLEDPTSSGRGQWGHDVEVRGGKVGGRGAEDEISLEEMNVPNGAIRVKDEVVVTSSDWIDYRDRLY